MFGYAFEPDICRFPQNPKWGVFRESIFASLAQFLLRKLSGDKPRANCLLTSFLTRVAAWDKDHRSIKIEPGKARKRRLIILRFNGD